jgi:hypothetical protein
VPQFRGFVLVDGDGITRLRIFSTDQGQLEIFVMIAQKPDWLPLGSWCRREDGFWQSLQWGFGTMEEMIQSVEKVCCANITDPPCRFVVWGKIVGTSSM